MMILVVIDGDFSAGCDCLSVVEDLWRWWFTALLYVNVIAETNLSLRNHTCLAHIKHVTFGLFISAKEGSGSLSLSLKLGEFGPTHMKERRRKRNLEENTFWQELHLKALMYSIPFSQFLILSLFMLYSVFMCLFLIWDFNILFDK